MFRKNWLEQLKTKLNYGTHNERVAAAKGARARVRTHLAALKQRLGSLFRQSRQESERFGDSADGSHTPAEQEHERHGVFWRVFQGAFAFVDEVVLTAFLAQAWATGRWFVAVGIGFLMSLVLFVVAKALWQLGGDVNNPIPEFKKKDRRLWFVGVLLLMVAGVLVLGRIYPIVSTRVYDFLLGVLSILLAIFAAGAFTVAGLLDRRNKLARRYLKVQQEVASVQLVADEIDELLREDQASGAEEKKPLDPQVSESKETGKEGGYSGPPPPPGSTPDGGTGDSSSPPTVLNGMLAFFLLASAAHGQVFQFWFDVSGSVPLDAGTHTVSAVCDVLEDEQVTGEVQVFTFAEAKDALAPPRRVFGFAPRPDAEPCESRSESAQLLKWAAEEETARCEAKREAALVPYRKARDQSFRELREVLSDIDFTQRHPRTCLLQVFERCWMESQETVCVVVTDGRHEECPMPKATNPKKERAGPRIVVVLTPSTMDGQYVQDEMFKRAKSLAKQPSTIVVPYFKIVETLPELLH